MKKYIALCILLTVAGAFLCVDMRTLELVRFLDFDRQDIYYKLPGNEADRKLADAYIKCDLSYKNIQKIRPDDYIWLIQAAWLNDLKNPEKDKLIAKLRKLDPQNGCSDYLQAAIYAQKAGNLNFDGEKREFELTDRAALEKAVHFYLLALQKPYVRFYSMERPSQVIDIMSIPHDPTGTVQRIGLYARALLPHLTHLRFLASAVTHYAEILDREGKKDESRKLLASGRDFVLHWAKDNSDTLIENLVYYAVIGVFHESAKTLNDTKMIALYGKVVNEHTRWKNLKDQTGTLAVRYGGILSAMILPALKNEIEIERFTPERKLTYLAIDRLVLILFAILTVITILLLALCAAIGKLRRQEIILIKFSPKAWATIIGIGMILPIVIFLIFIRVDSISGRFLSIYFNKQGLITSSLLLVFAGAWLTAALRIEMKNFANANFASRCLSKILPYALLLFLTGAILSTYFEIEEIYYCRKDTLFANTKGFSSIENQVTKQRTEKLINCLK